MDFVALSQLSSHLILNVLLSLLPSHVIKNNIVLRHTHVVSLSKIVPWRRHGYKDINLHEFYSETHAVLLVRRKLS
jgi:hypothetical protein